MAVRSGAGTGVVVSLVVFIFTTIFGIVFTIVFYSGQVKAREDLRAAEASLDKYVKPAQRSNDQYKQFEQAASRVGQSVVGYLNGTIEKLTSKLDGNPRASMAEIDARAETLGMGTDSAFNTIETLTRRGDSRESEIQSKNDLIRDLNDEKAEMQAQFDQLRQAHQQAIAALEGQMSGYSTEADRYRTDVEDTKARIEAMVTNLRADHEADYSRLESEHDECALARVQLEERVDSLQNLLKEKRLRSVDPALLVDATVISTVGGDQFYIDRGSNDRMTLGMTFEVYKDAQSIRPDPQTGALPRGLASAQVIEVGTDTSKCKITDSTLGRPVVRNHVLANAVYDPTYQFKFLVHGKYDVDGDGRPTESEADFIRSMIIDWGGVVVTGEQLTGDLDFLVLGAPPVRPVPVDVNTATDAELQENRRRRGVYNTYQRLLDQATNAQIPVINSNRFFVLIGQANR